MKKLIITIFLAPVATHAAAPATSCPSGFVAINEPYLTIANGLCPSGTTSVGAAPTCLSTNPVGSCMMYAPAATTYTDASGSYEFTQICPLT